MTRSRIALILLPLMILTGCGGRAARPVEISTSIDDKLSCIHIEGQYSANINRMLDLQKERQWQSGNNAPKLLLGLAGLMLLNLNNAEKKEILALEARNARLLELSDKKNCKVIPVERSVLAQSQ
ncbi:hypothetical protein [Kiloniella sp. b19]|uniref:hypothetical protein n=1 Tax=Kiloniella sp. GXU_MW_B19 TaxID=3141326 RepID=UPI0031DEEA50